MNDTTDTPRKRGRPVAGDNRNLIMFSARVDEALYESVRELAFKLRISKQDILRDALELFKAKHNGEKSPTSSKKQ